MWKTVRLGDVVSYEKVNGQGSNRPYVGMEHISSETMELVGSLEIPEKTSSTFKFDERHVLFGRLRPYLRKVFVPDFDGQCSTEIFCLLPSDKVDKRFLAHWLLHPKVSTRINETSTGARMPRANMNAILDFDFPLPPLAEQQRIVAKLDAAFAEIDRAIGVVNSKEAEVQKLEGSLLSSSIGGNTMMWKTVKLGDVCNLVGGGTPSKKNDDYYDGDIPWATVRDMSVDELSFTEHKITELGLKNSSSKVIPENNVIIASRVGLGKVCILRQDTAINQDLRGVIPKRENEIDKSFLFYWFKGIASKIIGAGRGATVQGVTLPFLNSLSFPLPPLAEQQRIVAKLDAASSEFENANESIIKCKANYLALKSAILAQELQGEAA
jgi:type I restriction enzyme S subunit